MTKKYTTYYLDEEVVKALDKEKNKSSIVNDIMRKHYLNIRQEAADFDAAGIRYKTENKFENNTIKTTIKPNEEDVEKFKKEVGLNCKIHGTRMDVNGYCTQKKCKYGK